MSDRLDLLPGPLRRVVEVAMALARAQGAPLYLIGGPVRDLLCGFVPKDVDLTVEQNAEALARELASRLGAGVRAYPAFQTTKLLLSDAPAVDITTTRRETYAHPGALPTVSRGTLADDLGRRDFAINAIALELLSGTIHDPHKGMADIDGRLVRILHERSFLDDPTRVLRALRLGSRFGFSLEATTGKKLQEAVSSGALASVSRERIFRELFLAFSEQDPVAVLEAFAHYGVLGRVLGAQGVSLERTRASAQLARRTPRLDPEVLWLASLLTTAPDPASLEGSGLSSKRIDLLRNALEAWTVEAAAAARIDLRAASPETLAILEHRFPSILGASIGLLRAARGLELPFGGDALGVPPGPHIGRALWETREAIARGGLPAGNALGFARELALKYLEAAK